MKITRTTVAFYIQRKGNRRKASMSVMECPDEGGADLEIKGMARSGIDKHTREVVGTMFMSHAIHGIDVTTPAYLQGMLETMAVECPGVTVVHEGGIEMDDRFDTRQRRRRT